VARKAIFIGKKAEQFDHLREYFREFLLRLLILVAREGFLKDNFVAHKPKSLSTTAL